MTQGSTTQRRKKMSLESELDRLKRLVGELNKLNKNTVRKEDVLRILEFLKEFIPLLIRTIKTR